jgi:signal transduction histidine kinase
VPAAPPDPDFERGLLRVGKQLTLGRLTPGVIHELNNPLFAILGLLELTLPELEPGSKARERLELIQRSGMEIREIVGAVLDFARERPGDRGTLSLTEVAEGSARLFRRTSVVRDVDFVIVPADGPAAVDGSANLLAQLFLALFENAHLAMPRGGTITITVSASREVVRAAIRDEGSGIEPGVEARIFDPYFSTRSSEGAAGLGLTLARAVAHDHGGELELASTSPAGSVFALELPGRAG